MVDHIFLSFTNLILKLKLEFILRFQKYGSKTQFDLTKSSKAITEYT